MAAALPPNPSLENLKNQARSLQKAWRAAEPRALARVRAAHPRYAGASDDELRNARPRLTECQLVLAREAGFDSWPQLTVAVRAGKTDLPDRFVTLACLCYDDPHYDHRSFHARAHELIRQNPGLAEAHIWCAAASGHAAAVAAFLDAQPSLVDQPGPNGWAPLICACYSRVPSIDPRHCTFEVARLLLDRGADPNAFTLKGSRIPRRFTALAGVFGGGSTGLANQPPHRRWRELAELLLERGADPADERALWINQEASLEILVRHGLGPEAAADGITLMGRALSLAVRRGHADHVRLLLAHHARTDETFDGRTPWQHAMGSGNLEIARMLEEAGAPVSDLDDMERFVSACLAGDGAGARAMLAHAPDLLDRAPRNLVLRACGTRRKDALTLVLDLGFDPDYLDEVTPLQSAAGDGNEELVRVLLARGASLTARDPYYDGTAIEWAEFFDHARLRDMLLDEKGICLFDAIEYGRFDRIPDVLQRDPSAIDRPFAECLSRQPRPEDWKTPLVWAIEKGRIEAVRILLQHRADASIPHPDGRTPLQLATDLGFQDMIPLLRGHVHGAPPRR